MTKKVPKRKNAGANGIAIFFQVSGKVLIWYSISENGSIIIISKSIIVSTGFLWKIFSAFI